MSEETLSSKLTFSMKRIFPLIWFGFIGMFAIYAGVAWKQGFSSAWILLSTALPMAVIGFLAFRRSIWLFADRVSLVGDQLIVSMRGTEERIRLNEIANVRTTGFTDPILITLNLRKSGKFGDKIMFVPRSEFKLNPFAKNNIAEKLTLLTERARQQERSL